MFNMGSEDGQRVRFRDLVEEAVRLVEYGLRVDPAKHLSISKDFHKMSTQLREAS